MSQELTKALLSTYIHGDRDLILENSYLFLKKENEKGKEGSHALLTQQTQIAGYLHDDVSQKNPEEQKRLTENTKTT